MNHFNFKSLTFYGVAITSVLVLFKVVSAYGESNLKASQTISDRYNLALSENLPNCQKSDSLILNIQQSGIYVNASLLPTNKNISKSKTTQEKHSLTGLFQNQELNLSGKIPQSTLCQNPDKIDNSVTNIALKMQLVNPGNNPGQLTASGIPQTLKFTAEPQKAEEEPQKSNNH